MNGRRSRRWAIGVVPVVGLVLIGGGLLDRGALAGGWATVHLDDRSTGVVAGEPVVFGFTVMQHDVTPFPGAKAELTATHRSTGATITAAAREDGPVGHYVVEVVFPESGEWKWGVIPTPFEGTWFATLIVREPGVDPRLRFAWTRFPRLLASRAAPVAPDPALEVEIGMAASAFLQPYVEVPVGATVTWVNGDSLAHTVTGTGLAFGDSGPLQPGRRSPRPSSHPEPTSTAATRTQA